MTIKIRDTRACSQPEIQPEQPEPHERCDHVWKNCITRWSRALDRCTLCELFRETSSNPPGLAIPCADMSYEYFVKR